MSSLAKTPATQLTGYGGGTAQCRVSHIANCRQLRLAEESARTREEEAASGDRLQFRPHMSISENPV